MPTVGSPIFTHPRSRTKPIHTWGLLTRSYQHTYIGIPFHAKDGHSTGVCVCVCGGGGGGELVAATTEGSRSF